MRNHCCECCDSSLTRGITDGGIADVRAIIEASLMAAWRRRQAAMRDPAQPHAWAAELLLPVVAGLLPDIRRLRTEASASAHPHAPVSR